MHIFLPPLLIGALAILLGILGLVFRNRIASANARGNRRFFGDAGERVAQSSTPGQTVLVGILMIGIGVMLIIFSLVQ